MTFSGELDARYRWIWCPDCNLHYTAANKDAHAKKHLLRPADGAMSLKEIAELIGKTQGEVNHLVRTGRLETIAGLEKRPRKWVTREGLAKYAQGELEKGNLRLMELLTTKKRRQNWMPMPEKKVG